MRLRFDLASAKQFALIFGAAATAAAGAAFVHSSVLALRATLQAPVSISIGSKLELLNARFALNDEIPNTVTAPQVGEVKVARPRIKPQTFKQRSFAAGANIAVGANIVIDIDPNADRDEELDTQMLAAIFQPKPTTILMARKTIHRNKKIVASVPLATQAASAPMAAAVPAPTSASASAPISATMKIEPQMASIVALNDVQGPDRYGYSEIIQYLKAPSDPDLDVKEPSDVDKPLPLKPQSENNTPTHVKGWPATAPADEAAAKVDSQPVALVSAASATTHEDTEAGNDTSVSTQVNTQDQTANAPIDVKKVMAEEGSLNSQEAASGMAGYVAYYQPTTSNVAAAPVMGPPAPPALMKQASGVALAPTPSQPQAATPPAPAPSQHGEFEGLAVNDVAEPTPTPTPTPSPSPTPTPAPTVNFGGHVLEAFTGGATAVANANVQILGTQWSTTTDDHGFFSFAQASVEGILPVVITKDGYLKRLFELRKGVSADVELVQENSLSLAVVAAGASKSSNGSFIYGQLTSPANETLDGARVEVNGPGSAQPIYIDDNGIPNRLLSRTSTRGQFMLLNLQAGTYLITVVDALGRERAPHVLYVGEYEGVVRKFGLGEQHFIVGRVLNAGAANTKVDGARVQFLGSTATATTDPSGRFTLGPVFVDCKAANYVQVEKTGFYRNRLDYACGNDQVERQLYAFSAASVDGSAADANATLNASTGAIMGHVGFSQSVKMQLWGPEELNPADTGRGTDYYYDNDGVVNLSRNRTSSNGNFLILGAPDGLSYIQAFSKDNKTLSYWPIFTSASTVNVYVQ